jgi:hypothetical protein
LSAGKRRVQSQELGTPRPTAPDEDGEPVFRVALHATLSTLEGRARSYRNVLVAASLVSVPSILLAGVLRRWSVLLGLLLLVPLSGAMLYLDARRVRQWLAEILELWRRRGLNLTAFGETIDSIAYVPRASVAGMLAALPKKTPTFDPERASESEKEAVAARLAAVVRRHERFALLGTATLLMVAVLAVAAVALRSIAILGSMSVPIVVLVALRRAMQESAP